MAIAVPPRNPRATELPLTLTVARQCLHKLPIVSTLFNFIDGEVESPPTSPLLFLQRAHYHQMTPLYPLMQWLYF